MKFLFTVALPYDLNCVIYLIQIIIDIAIGRFINKNYTCKFNIYKFCKNEQR